MDYLGQPEGVCVAPDVMPKPGFYWACVDGKAKQVRKADREPFLPPGWIPPGQGNYPMPWLHKQAEIPPVEPAVSGSGPLPALIAGGIALWALTQ